MSKYFTKGEARAASSSIISKSYITKSAAQVLTESRESARESETFDVFLSHAIDDAALVLGVKVILERLGFKVYVDWDTDSNLDRSKVGFHTAELLRTRMRQSKSLIYLATKAATASKWMPWELGYFDGFRNGQVAVMPLLENETEKYEGQEYLDLYPEVTKDTYKNSSTIVDFVEDRKKKRWTTLKYFGSGMPRWSDYTN